MARTLYICYFGLREPLVQTQVIPYLLEIIKGGIEVSLLTFEPGFRANWTKEQIREEREKLAAKGIAWHALAYHKRPSVPATAYDVLAGTFFIWRLLRREKIDVLHGRVHLPTLMGALARKFSRQKPKLLFDIRGFFPEEYTDAGIWPEDGWLYRSAKRVERWLMKEADGFVVLTEKAREILFPESKETGVDRFGRPVEVIPCCVDISRFGSATAESREKIRRQLDIGDRPVVAYVGGFGGWYLTRETADFFGAARQRDARTFAMVLTQSDPAVFRQLLEERGFLPSDYFIGKVPPSEVPVYLSGADVAVSFIRQCYSKLASSPTKNAEYLACGLPVIANRGVGDLDELIDGNEIGALVNDFSPQSYARSLQVVADMGNISQKCISTAARKFELGRIGGERYRGVYRKLLDGKNA